MNNFTWYGVQAPLVRLDESVQTFSEADLTRLIKKHETEIGQEVPNLSKRFSNEAIFNLNSYDAVNNVITLGITTGTMAKALQNVHKGKDPSQKPALVQGMVFTDDGKIVLGVRSKPKKRQNLEPTDYKLMFSPVGYAQFNSTANLDEAFFKELDEELNLQSEDLSDYRIAGHHHDTAWSQGFRFTYIVKTGLPSTEVEQRWQQADHAWEYTGLVFVDAALETIDELLKAKDFSSYASDANGLLEGVVKAPLEFYVGNNGEI